MLEHLYPPPKDCPFHTDSCFAAEDCFCSEYLKWKKDAEYNRGQIEAFKQAVEICEKLINSTDPSDIVCRSCLNQVVCAIEAELKKLEV
jgi:hypothetical protein